MARWGRRVGRERRASFARDASGVAAVEFGLIATLMLALMLGVYDLTSAYMVQRDVRRVSVEISQSMATCGLSQTCMIGRVRDLIERKANLLIDFPEAQLGMAAIARRDGNIEFHGGPMTYLDSDILAHAKNILSDNGDCGAVSLITYSHKPLFLNLSQDWGLKIINLRSFAVSLSYKDCRWVGNS